MQHANTPIGLPALEARFRQDLDWLELPAKPWVKPRPDGTADVAIIGGGMCGLAAAAALKLMGIEQQRVLDRAPQGQEGPWVTFARMVTLRSPKTLSGPALGFGALTFRAWYEAQHGSEAWAALGKIPRGLWMDYLIWYRRVLGISVENDTDVALVRPRGDGLIALDLTDGREITCRRLVLATGRDGLGGAHVPPQLVTGIDRRFWAHAREEIDFAALRGRRVGVIGAGATAMDNAAMALEAGCARLDMVVRRRDLPRINKFTGIGSQGVVHGFAGLPDEWKWRFQHYALSEQTPPPRDSTLRVFRHAHAHLHLGSPVTALREAGDTLHIVTPKGEIAVDFLILATGFGNDFAQRPELRLIAPHIRLWGDRFAVEPGLEHEELRSSPDLAPDFTFQEKTPGTCPALARIHCFNHPASLSAGKVAGDIPAVSAGAQRLARGIARSLFVEDRGYHFERLQAFDTPELLGDEYPREDTR